MANSTFGIRVSVSRIFTLNIPPNSNVRIILKFACVDTTGQFGSIQSLKIVSIGQNVNGLMREYNASLINPVLSSSGVAETFYSDSIMLDLGIITNTSIRKQTNHSENYVV